MSGRHRVADSDGPARSLPLTLAVSLALLSGTGANPLRAQVGADGSGWSVSSEPVLEIGGSPVDPHQQLFGVVDALRVEGDGEGRGFILIANGGTHEIRRYALDGTWLGAFGREGDGPGEFRSIRRIGLLPGDSVHVFDSTLRRLSLFTPSGEVARDRRVLGSGGRARTADLVRVGADGWVAIEPDQARGHRAEMWRERLHRRRGGPYGRPWKGCRVRTTCPCTTSWWWTSWATSGSRSTSRPSVWEPSGR